MYALSKCLYSKNPLFYSILYKLHQRNLFVVPGSQEPTCIIENLVVASFRKDATVRKKKTVKDHSSILNCAICRCAMLLNTVLITAMVTIFKSEVLVTVYTAH